MNFITIEVFTKKATSKSGEKFITYYTKTKDGKNYVSIKFTKKKKKKPKFHSMIIVNEDCANVVNYGKNIVLWVSKIDTITPIKEDLNKYFEVANIEEIDKEMQNKIK